MPALVSKVRANQPTGQLAGPPGGGALAARSSAVAARAVQRSIVHACIVRGGGGGRRLRPCAQTHRKFSPEISATLVHRLPSAQGGWAATSPSGFLQSARTERTPTAPSATLPP